MFPFSAVLGLRLRTGMGHQKICTLEGLGRVQGLGPSGFRVL